MSSGKQSWFARHMAPPPPINNTPICPCATCYNLGTHVVTASRVSSVPRSAMLRRSGSDNASIASFETSTTTTHVEHVKN
ncbi:Fc.00g030400.m01.CDS01 [Cosmosporella sp. VM-42]